MLLLMFTHSHTLVDTLLLLFAIISLESRKKKHRLPILGRLSSTEWYGLLLLFVVDFRVLLLLILLFEQAILFFLLHPSTYQFWNINVFL
jgi:hypothetical protein